MTKERYLLMLELIEEAKVAAQRAVKTFDSEKSPYVSAQNFHIDLIFMEGKKLPTDEYLMVLMPSKQIFTES